MNKERKEVMKDGRKEGRVSKFSPKLSKSSPEQPGTRYERHKRRRIAQNVKKSDQGLARIEEMARSFRPERGDLDVM